MDILGSIGKMMTALSGDTFGGKVLIAAGSLATAYFTPIVGLLFACFACTTIDLVYGIKVAKRAGKKLTSRKTWKGTLTKIRDEFTIIMLSHILEYSVMGAEGMTVLSGGATALICLTEIWSILENLNTLDPSGPWRILSKFLKKKGEDYTGIEIDLNENGKINSIKPVKTDELDEEQ